MKFKVNQAIETSYFTTVKNAKGRDVQRTTAVKLYEDTLYDGPDDLFSRLSELGYASEAADSEDEAILL